MAAAVMLAVLAGVVQARQSDDKDRVFVNVNSSGGDQAASLCDQMQNALFHALKDRYPCVGYLDSSAVRTMLDIERQRELTGAADESRLPAIAKAVGAPYLVWVDIVITGGNVSISGAAAAAAGAKTFARDGTVVPAQAAGAAITQLANRLVAQMGSSGPSCGRWSGTIAATSGVNKNGKNEAGKSYTTTTNLKIECRGDEGRSEASCDVSYSSAIVGDGAQTKASADGPAQCAAGFGLDKGIARMRLGPCRIQGTTSISVEGTSASSKEWYSLGGWETQVPVAANARTLSGGKKVDEATTLVWSLSR